MVVRVEYRTEKNERVRKYLKPEKITETHEVVELHLSGTRFITLQKSDEDLAGVYLNLGGACWETIYEK